MPSYLSPGVYVEEVPSGSASLSAGATAIPAFVGFTAKAPTDDPTDPEGVKPRLVANWTQFVDLFGSFQNGIVLPLSVYGWFNNGGGICYVTRIANSEPASEPGAAALPAADKALGNPLEISTIEPNADISVDILPEADGDDEDAPPTFTLLVTEAGDDVESFEGLTLAASDRNVEAIVNAESEKVKVATKVDLSDVDIALTMLQGGTFAIEPATPTPISVKGKAFTGSEVDRTGINGLVIADDVTMVIVPDLVTAATDGDGNVDLGMWKAVQTALINHCEGQANRMAILDSPPGMNVQQIKDWRSDVAMYDSAFAAMYFPWIKVDNPAATNGDTEVLVPPSGHIAGIWARTDDTRGVWKAPANEIVRGALDVELPITKGEQGLLNPIGINCIRPFGTRGIRVWGARTLSSDTDWRYVNVRRLFNMIETAIMDGTQFVVFEPNDEKLWAGVTRTVAGFLRGLWRDGALFGSTAEQAFYVKCDAETNPPESIDEGKLVVEVGIAPVKPAEFVIFRISQKKESSA
ncbi:MAG: phage tail sheath subtilisin-like domain-containing protein [Acidimicrobiia bacterium]|nr:phage tail sheath subtilisin-like domain-containing protein [Acidimicrobiia bacterium]